MNENRTKLIIGFILLTSLMYSKGRTEQKEILIASGGGYKKPVEKVSSSFEESLHVNVNNVFGNMQTLSAQIRESGKVGIMIGDRKFLMNPQLGVEYDEYLTIGRGKLVLAYRKGIEIDTAEALANRAVQRISLPDREKAIYGLAAWEYLTGKGLWNDLEEKILMASTVTQVSSYLISGEVDAGFINLTDAVAIADDIGGYIPLESGYSEIEIVAGLVKGFEEDGGIRSYLNYLTSEEAEEIFQSYGL